MSGIDLADKINAESDQYAASRKYAYKKVTKKITGEALRHEINIARYLGELSGAERLLRAIVENKEWTKEDIEAELHVFVQDLNNSAAKMLGKNEVVGLEDILKMYGYFNEEKA